MITFLNKYKNKWFLVSDFCSPNAECFIGYKANTRLSELIGKGYVENRQHGDTRFMEYKLRDDVRVTHISEQEIELWILSPSL